MRLIDASRVFGQIISGQSKGPRPRSTADLLIFTDAAFALALSSIAQSSEQLGIPVHIGERVLEHVAAGQWQKAAGEDRAVVRDEHEALSVAHSGGAPCHALGVFVFGDAVLGLDAL